MKKSPSISIAIPTYNEEQNIGRCLKSIFRQNYEGRLEVFVVDGGSRDKTLEIARFFPVKILHNPFKDAEHGKMLALKKATGKYFLYLDADIDLPGDKWFEKMIRPLEEDRTIVGSFTRFLSYKDDPPLSRYLTLDPLQRDPLFSWLTPRIDSVIKTRKKGYFICEYQLNKVLPAGLCVYRRRQIVETEIGAREKFMELDNLVILINEGLNKFAYVPGAGLHHPFLPDIIILLRKRVRNIRTMFFNQPDKRYWKWVDFDNKKAVLRLLLWVFYAESLVLPAIIGVVKSLRYMTWVGLYEPLVAWLTTNVIVLVFFSSKEGWAFLCKKS